MWTLPETPDVIVAFGTLLAGSAAVWGAYSAHRGVDAWKKEKRWQSDHELARKILMLIFRHRDALATVRHPAIWSAETKEAMAGKEAFSDYSEKRFSETAAVYERRWDKVTEVRAELYPALLEADVIWGSTLKDLVAPVFELEFELKIVLQTYLRAINPNGSEATREVAQQSLREKRDIMYDTLSEDDEFRRDYEKGQQPLEILLRAKMGGAT
ncbi:hypothetical protein [uncultured Aliiroseovarius sp.]|uniref:hypothetical protein n=1 Tax=uncultured Aliiroseovarius sp. TaxID=1658783 RepID=UPI002618B672|nr:hypothetical protein [uncultured Aliiroseovarius sp.]